MKCFYCVFSDGIPCDGQVTMDYIINKTKKLKMEGMNDDGIRDSILHDDNIIGSRIILNVFINQVLRLLNHNPKYCK